MIRVNRNVVRLAALAGLLVLAWLVWKLPAVHTLVTREHLLALRDRLGSAWWGPVAFVVGYAVLAAFEFSGLLLTIAGGIIFGFTTGVLLNTIGANVGASAAYGIARVLGKDAVARILGKHFARVHELTHRGGFLWLLRLRLIPVIPFNLLNFAAGLAGMPWKTFAAATAAGILPGTIVYTFFADSIMAGSLKASRDAVTRLLIAGAFVLLLTFVPAIVRRLRASRAQR